MNSLIRYLILLTVAFINLLANGQFATVAGTDGTTAIHKSSDKFVSWATGCEVTRGLIQIDDPGIFHEGSNHASNGVPDNAIGYPDGSVVSLGDSGIAILTFDIPVVNGEGYDFAVFENGFYLAGSDSLAFLEFAFVEVSSDGEHYVRFPSEINISQDEQVNGMGYLNASRVHNLAGKYILNYGTPFDLQDLDDSNGIDLNNIRYVKLIDVIGNIQDEYAHYDSKGNKINDPWPTPYWTGGFDLDAVGVIHTGISSGTSRKLNSELFNVYPNPFTTSITINPPDMNLENKKIYIELFDLDGKLLFSRETSGNREIFLDFLDAGCYLMKLHYQGKNFNKLIIKK